ncbi:hypothetical protein [Flocculibacter collagenilyticus]|uniref:hypothetical protein n=1 Tax=Flocculibacter collagenilyticus TaxID=2744479 RepID=UPI0018F37974|nr:hypothetical protein [Flocculibacter collagenilyticus]
MLRIKSSALEKREGKHFFKNKPFIGFAYRISDSNYLNTKRYFQGLYVNNTPEELPLFNINGGQTSTVSAERLTPSDSYTGEPFILLGQPYNGVALEFENEFCTGQHLYQNGMCIATISWYMSGQIEALECDKQPLFLEVEWTKDGHLSFLDVLRTDTYSVRIKYDAKGYIESICGENDVESFISDLKTEELLHYISDDLSKKKRLSEKVFFSGNIEKLIQTFVDFSSINSLSQLTLFHTTIPGSYLSKILELNKIEILDITGCPNLMPLIRVHLDKTPDCTLILNE